MDRLEFTAGMMRIMDRFGKKRYTPDVNAQIWEHWQHHPESAWNRLINDLLIRKSSAPLPVEFITAAKYEANKRLRLVTEHTHAPEMESIFSTGERREIFDFVKNSANGKVPRKHALQFAKSIQNVLELKAKTRCGKCRDGALMAYQKNDKNSLPFVFLCNCNKGLNRQESWPQWSEELRTRYTPVSEMFKKELDESMNPDGPSAS